MDCLISNQEIKSNETRTLSYQRGEPAARRAPDFGWLFVKGGEKGRCSTYQILGAFPPPTLFLSLQLEGTLNWGSVEAGFKALVHFLKKLLIGSAICF